MTAICKGSMELGNGCGECLKCKQDIMNNKGRIPIGEFIEVKDGRGVEFKWSLAKILYMGRDLGLGVFDDGHEFVVGNHTEWRYPINHEQQKRDEIMDAWRAQGIDYAYDNDLSKPCIRYFLKFLIDKGFVEVEK